MSNNKSQLKLGIILNYINMGIGTLIPIFYTPVMLKLLGQGEYGLYKLSSSVCSYLGLLSFGLGTAVSRYIIKARIQGGKDEEEKIFGLFLRFFRYIALSSFIIGCILVLCLPVWYSDSLSSTELEKMKILVFIMVCNTSLNFSVSPYLSVVSAHEKFLFIQCMNIISTSVAPFINLLMLFLGFASIGLAVSSLVINIIVRIIYLIFVTKNLELKPQFKKMGRNIVKEIFVFSIWVFVASLVSHLYNSTDTVMIGAIPTLGTKAVAVYNVGTTFSGIMTSLTIGVSSLLTPKTNKMVFSGADNKELTDLAIRVGRIQGYIVTLIASGFIAFGRPFLHFYAGDEYKDSFWVAISLMLPNLIPLVQSVCLSIIIAKNKHKFRSLTYLGIAVLNVIGTWFLMQTSLGVVGAALMTGIALIFGQGFVMNWYYSVKIKLEMKRFWKEVGKLYLIPAGMCVITFVLSNIINLYSLTTLLICICIYTIVYILFNWLFVMNVYEKEILIGPIRKLLKYRKHNKC